MKLLRAATLAVAVSFAGCSTPMKPMQDQSLYQRLGGKEAITAVVDDFIGNVAATAGSTGASPTPTSRA
jgi:hemoglobin